MSTRITDKCDRCGSESERPTNARIGRKYRLELRDEAREAGSVQKLPVEGLFKDLCRPCAERLVEWFTLGQAKEQP
jgi:hypothetical protein